MENNQHYEEIHNSLEELNTELEKKKEELIKEINSSERLEKPPKSEKDLGEIIGDLFYNSMKTFFDMGNELAENLSKIFKNKNSQK
ncbi:MAG: hypothetical protein ACFFD5_07235 [Candidatus Thorarchaeota archaeon]